MVEDKEKMGRSNNGKRATTDCGWTTGCCLTHARRVLSGETKTAQESMMTTSQMRLERAWADGSRLRTRRLVLVRHPKMMWPV